MDEVFCVTGVLSLLFLSLNNIQMANLIKMGDNLTEVESLSKHVFPHGKTTIFVKLESKVKLPVH